MKHAVKLSALAAALAVALGALAAPAAQAQSATPAITTTPAQPQAQDGPEATIKKAVEGVTAAINADRSVQSGDRKRILQLVDAKIVPFLDQDAMTRAAIGPNWAKATPQQQQELIQQFKILLTNTYTGAFTAYRADTQIEYKPTRIDGDSAVVRSLVQQGTGAQPVAVDYYLEKTAAGWKVIDIAVFSARVVELYKGQFNAAIAQNGVDGLIKSLKAKNGSDTAKG